MLETSIFKSFTIFVDNLSNIHMRQLAKILILSLVIALFSTTAEGQKFRKKSKYMTVGLALGTTNYVGELDPGASFVATSPRFTRWNIGGELTKRFHPRISGRTSLSYGRIQGSDVKSATDPEGWEPYRRVRNLNFRNDLFELKFDGIVDLYQNRRGLEKRVKLTPYGFLGIGFLYHNPKGQLPTNGEWVSLRPLGTEGQYVQGSDAKPYSLFQIVVPMGLGIRYKIGVLWDVSFEIGWRKTFTDYLDDVGGTYVDKANFAPGTPEYIMSDPSIYLEDNPLKQYELNGHTYTNGYGRNGDQRGDDNADWYIITGFRVSYIFHPKLIAPKFKG